MTALHDASTGRFVTAPLARRRAAASTTLRSVTTLSPTPSISISRAGGGGERLGEGAEAADQLLRDRLHVAARDRAEQHDLQELVIRQGVAAGLREARPQPVAVAVVVGIVATMMGQIRRVIGTMMMRVIPTMMRIIPRLMGIVPLPCHTPHRPAEIPSMERNRNRFQPGIWYGGLS